MVYKQQLLYLYLLWFLPQVQPGSGKLMNSGPAEVTTGNKFICKTTQSSNKFICKRTQGTP